MNNSSSNMSNRGTEVIQAGKPMSLGVFSKISFYTFEVSQDIKILRFWDFSIIFSDIRLYKAKKTKTGKFAQISCISRAEKLISILNMSWTI